MATSDKESRLITKEKVNSGSPYKIPQSERLYTLRPRYFNDPTTRGRIATFRIQTRGVDVAPSSDAAAALAERVRKKLISESGMADFLVQDIQLGFNEKAHVIQTFGDAETVYYFGQTPTTITITGSLFDDLDNDWFTRFVVGYNQFLRGTQLAKNFELLELSTHNATFTGTLMNLQLTQSAVNDTHVPFTCTMLLRSFEFHSTYQYGVELSDDVQYYKISDPSETDPSLSQAEVNKIKGKALKDAMKGKLDSENISSLGDNSRILTAEDEPIATAPTSPSVLSVGGVYATGESPSTNKKLGEGVDSAAKLGKKSPLNKSPGGLTEKLTELSKSINKFARVAGEDVTDFLDPINDIIGSVSDISSAAFSVVTAIDTTVSSVLDPITVTVQSLNNTRQNLKNLRGTITSLPENLSEKLSRFARSGGIQNPNFLKSPSAEVNSAEALSTMKDSNVRTIRDTGQVGPPSQASNTADQVARL